MSKFKFFAAIAALAVMAGPALAGKKPTTAGASANPPPGKQMQEAFPSASDRGSSHGASGFVPQNPPGQATRLSTPGTPATTHGKTKN